MAGIRTIDGHINTYPVENSLSGTAVWNTEYKLDEISSLSFTIPSYTITDAFSEIRVVFSTASSWTSATIDTSNYSNVYGIETFHPAAACSYEISIKPISSTEALFSFKEYMKVWTALIPTMTSNTAPSGTCSATIYRSGYQNRAYMAFDGNDSTIADVWYGQAFSLSTMTCYEWASAVTVNKVYWKGYIDGNGSFSQPAKAQYKNSGGTWVDLFTYSDLEGEKVLDSPISLLGIRMGAVATSTNRGMLFYTIQCYN